MLLAEGAVDIAAEPELGLHDMAALVPIVTEAGGRFTSLAGRRRAVRRQRRGDQRPPARRGAAPRSALLTPRRPRQNRASWSASVATPSSRRSSGLALQPAGVAGERAVGADDPVAGQHDGQRVGAVGGADRARGPRRQPEPRGDGAVGGRRAPRARSRARPRPGAGSRCPPGAAGGRTPGGCRRSTRRAGGAPRRARATRRARARGEPSAGASKWMATSAPPASTSSSRPIGRAHHDRAGTTVLRGQPCSPAHRPGPRGPAPRVAASPTSTTLHSPVATRR